MPTPIPTPTPRFMHLGRRLARVAGRARRMRSRRDPLVDGDRPFADASTRGMADGVGHGGGGAHVGEFAQALGAHQVDVRVGLRLGSAALGQTGSGHDLTEVVAWRLGAEDPARAEVGAAALLAWMIGR